jgi:hypothetical protein
MLSLSSTHFSFRFLFSPYICFILPFYHAIEVFFFIILELLFIKFTFLLFLAMLNID